MEVVQIQIIILIEIIVMAMSDDFIICNLVLINNNRRLLKNSQKLFNRIDEMEI